MKNPDIQKATASEPLSLDEEYSMQHIWRQHSDKLTFITCLPLSSAADAVKAGQEDAPDHMLGDVNLFLTMSEEDDETVIGEIELMVAPVSSQGKGYGRASLLAFLRYIAEHQGGI